MTAAACQLTVTELMMSTEQGALPHNRARPEDVTVHTAEDQVLSALRRQIQELGTRVEDLKVATRVRIHAAVWAAAIMAAVLASTAATWLTDVNNSPNFLPAYYQTRSFSLWDAPGAHQGLYRTPAAGAAGLVIASLVLMLIVSAVAAGTFSTAWAVAASIVSLLALGAEAHFGVSLSGQPTEIGEYHTGGGFTLAIVATVLLVIWAFAVIARRRKAGA